MQLEDLNGKSIEEQVDMLAVSAEMAASARDIHETKACKGSKKVKKIAYTGVFSANGCTTMLAANPTAGKATAGAQDRSGSQAHDYRFELGEVLFPSTMTMHDKVTKPVVVPMKVQSRQLKNYLLATSELPEPFGGSMQNVCYMYATVFLQPGHTTAQLDDGSDT